MTSAPQPIRLHEERATWLVEKLQGLLKRNARLGVDATMQVVVSDPILQWVGTDGRRARCEECAAIKAALADLTDEERAVASPGCAHCYESYTVRDITVTGTLPVLQDWRLVAVLSWERGLNGAEEIIVRTAPGETCPATYYAPGRQPTCDHCAVSRHRDTCYVLRHQETGEHKQVGKQCLADFVRNPNAAAVAEFLSMFGGALDEAQEAGGCYTPVLTLSRYLAAVCAVRRVEERFVTKRQGEERGVASTSAFASRLLFDARFASTSGIRIEAQDYKESAQVIAWALAKFPAGASLSEFEANMGSFARLGVVPRRSEGAAAYMPEAHRRDLALQTERTRAAVLPPKHLDAKVGERVEVDVTICRVVHFDNAYGGGYITVMRAEDGSMMSWKSKDCMFVRAPFGSRETDERDRGEWVAAMDGARVRVRATIKEHGEYKGRPQTTVSRVERVCDGWGYVAEPGSEGADLAARMIATGRNAPKAKPARRVRKQG